MLKGMSKGTSLLVATAAIISIIPASAADYKTINSQTGTIYNAIAYADGKFYIDGGVNNQDDATYYLANGKYNNLSDIDSGSSVEAFGSKYLSIQNGDYCVDLSNGSVTKYSIKSHSQDDTATALRKNVKKDTNGRYTVTDAGTIKNLTKKNIIGNKFTDLWYGVTYASDKSTNGGASSLNVYTDSKGNYIDADYNLGAIKVTTNNGSTDKTVTITNTNDKYDVSGTTKAVSASVYNQNVIGQDANYIYRTATVKIIVDPSATGVSITKINGKAINPSGSVFTTPGTAQTTFNVIQKISKAQASDNINGAKYAKSATTYVISKDNGVTLDSSHSLLGKYTISNEKLINYVVNGSSIKTQTVTLNSTNGYYYTDVNTQSNETAEVINSESAIDTDVNGNLWRLSKGYIYKWDNTKTWTKVYQVDSGFNQMSVYDDKNIVTWNKSNEIYSVIGGQATTTTTTTTTTPVVNKGWVNTATGWTFYNAAGAQVKGQWANDGGVWYYLKADGIMATGWIKDGSNWYFLSGSGAMKTGWLNDNGTWYYLNNTSGAMLVNTITPDGYRIGATGAWIR